jgi:hypothetical protein
VANKKPDTENLLPGHMPGCGRPKGSRNRKNLAYEALAEKDAVEIIKQVIAKALEGDMNAAQVILSRIWRVPRDRLVKIDLPPVACATEVPAFIGAVLKAVADAEITPAEGDSIASIIGKLQSAVTLVELEERIRQIEAGGTAAPRLAAGRCVRCGRLDVPGICR